MDLQSNGAPAVLDVFQRKPESAIIFGLFVHLCAAMEKAGEAGTKTMIVPETQECVLSEHFRDLLFFKSQNILLYSLLCPAAVSITLLLVGK